MSFVSTGNKPVGNGGPVITTPPIAGESGGISLVQPQPMSLMQPSRW